MVREAIDADAALILRFVRELAIYDRDQIAEFDLAYSGVNENRMTGAWVDIIFEGPEHNQIILRDVTFSRRPRADL